MMFPAYQRNLFVLAFGTLLLTAAAPPIAADDSIPSQPYAQSPFTDRNGREWNVDQNGNVQRVSNEPSLISNSAVLVLGNQQFYCQQPLVSPDGENLEMSGPKPYNGIAVTRRLRLLERLGGIAWADEVSNATSREIRAVVEFRHHFSGQVKSIITDAGRASPTDLQPGEGGIIVVPAQEDGSIPAVTLSIRGKRGATPPRLALRNSYQLSIFHTVVIPPASSVTLVHATGQVGLEGDTATETLMLKSAPWHLKRIARLLPKPWIRNAANLTQESALATLTAWYPTRHWDIERESSDLLALGNESLLKGRAVVENLVLDHEFGRLPIDWDTVVAIGGGGWPTAKSWWENFPPTPRGLNSSAVLPCPWDLIVWTVWSAASLTARPPGFRPSLRPA